MSPIHGVGLFADGDIPEETIIYKVDSFWTVKHTKDYVETLTELEQEFFKKYAWLKGNIYYMSLDNDRFMNHSYMSNTYETEHTTVTRRRIFKGEEITCDYTQLGIKPPEDL